MHSVNFESFKIASNMLFGSWLVHLTQSAFPYSALTAVAARNKTLIRIMSLLAMPGRLSRRLSRRMPCPSCSKTYSRLTAACFTELIVPAIEAKPSGRNSSSIKHSRGMLPYVLRVSKTKKVATTPGSRISLSDLHLTKFISCIFHKETHSSRVSLLASGRRLSLGRSRMDLPGYPWSHPSRE